MTTTPTYLEITLRVHNETLTTAFEAVKLPVEARHARLCAGWYNPIPSLIQKARRDGELTAMQPQIEKVRVALSHLWDWSLTTAQVPIPANGPVRINDGGLSTELYEALAWFYDANTAENSARFERERAELDAMLAAEDAAKLSGVSPGVALQTPISPDDYPVTLSAACNLAGLSDRTIEKRRDLPEPTLKGGRGKAALWRWGTIRGYLQPQTTRQLPERFPADTALAEK